MGFLQFAVLAGVIAGAAAIGLKRRRTENPDAEFDIVVIYLKGFAYLLAIVSVFFFVLSLLWMFAIIE